MSKKLFGLLTLFFAVILFASCSIEGTLEEVRKKAEGGPKETDTRFTVTFVSNGGTPVPQQKIEEGETISRPEDPSKNGYKLVNWFSDINFDEIYNFSTPVTGNISLYAKWVDQNAQSYVIQFNSRGGSLVVSQNVYGGEKVMRPTDPSNPGYGVENWFRDEEYTQPWNFSFDLVEGPMTLYVKWNLTYTVTYNKNATDATGTMADSNHIYNVDKNLNANAFTRPSSDFAGWATTADGEAVYTDGQSVNNLTATAGAVVVLYAKWNFIFEYELGGAGPGGGKVFYRSADGFIMTDTNETCHYLEAAPDNMSTELAWASEEHKSVFIDGTQKREIGTGRDNTGLILAEDAEAPAAKACRIYTSNGKTDWFLPSHDELNQMYLSKALIGNMGTSSYWSSSQSESYGIDAMVQEFSGGYRGNNSKTALYLVRAIRAF